MSKHHPDCGVFTPESQGRFVGHCTCGFDRMRNAAPDLLKALRLCVAWMPCAEVRSWPPGFRLRTEALEAALAAIAKAEGKP